MRSLIFTALLMITFLSPPVADAQSTGTFTCKISSSHGEVTMKPLSATETYMQSANFNGLTISTYQNEDGVSYTVDVKRGATILAQADIVMYQDTSLRLNTGKEMIRVQCLTAAQQ